jgi:hypothetical protein
MPDPINTELEPGSNGFHNFEDETFDDFSPKLIEARNGSVDGGQWGFLIC